jgi:hypothetical protein
VPFWHSQRALILICPAKIGDSALKYLFAVLILASASIPAFAQRVPEQDEDPVATAPYHFGVLGVRPTFQLTNLGVDTNVFNTPILQQKDTTFGAKPGSDFYLRTGHGLLTLDGWVEYVYYQKFASERTWNSYARGQYEWRFNKFRPYASASTLNTKERPGYEIDVRARRYETDFHVGGDVRVAPKTTIRTDFRHLDYTFAGDEVFNGRPLNQQLSRTSRAVELSWRQRLTALTTWVTKTSRETERFEFEPIRNSDSFRVSSGFELGRFALIRGSAFVGYRKFRPADGGIFPEYSGLTSTVNVAYTAPSRTRLNATVDRDLQYSYDSRTPYYVQTGWSTSLTQRITGRWDGQLTGGRDRLAYQAITHDGRTDFVSHFGGGIGYELGDQVRMSFDIQSVHRSSVVSNNYDGLRYGVNMTYGY